MRCHGDPRGRVVHLRGNGPNFCAGGDVREFASKGEELGDFRREVTAYLQMAVGALIRLSIVSSLPRYAAMPPAASFVTGEAIGVSGGMGCDVG